MSEETYEVFARRREGEPLLHVGAVRAAEPADAEVFAVALYGRWAAMLVAPRDAMIPVVAPE